MSAFVAFALVAGSAGTASARRREIGIRHTHFAVPTYATGSDHGVVAPTRPENRHDRLDEVHGPQARRAHNGYRSFERAR